MIEKKKEFSGKEKIQDVEKKCSQRILERLAPGQCFRGEEGG